MVRLCDLCLMNTLPQKLEAFSRLLTIMDELREQCPWDKKQTWDTLRHLTIEETFELAEAIIDGDANEVKKEAGDLMLHLVFYARIAEEQQVWDVADMINALCDKLISRHPHIYGDVKVADEAEVKRNWEALKRKEGNGNQSVLSGVPRGLPAMVKAMRIQEKARGAGFDWDEQSQVWAKVQEEMQELLDAQKSGDQNEVKKEFGDLLFSLINYARFIDVNPEESLELTNRKFINRFTHMEAALQAEGKQFIGMQLAEIDTYWEAAKNSGL